ncbi:hypothetical protein JND45_14990, partial [Listeria monocytogenes]|nr:hypothetical protein [Listeria monocytogenes]
MRYTRLPHLVPALALALAGTAALAATASDVIAARQAHYKDIGRAFK